MTISTYHPSIDYWVTSIILEHKGEKMLKEFCSEVTPEELVLVRHRSSFSAETDYRCKCLSCHTWAVPHRPCRSI